MNNQVKFTRVNYQDPSYTGDKLIKYRRKAKGEGMTINQVNAFKMICYNFRTTITIPQNKADASDKLTYLYGLIKLNKIERRASIPFNAKVVELDGKYVLVAPKVSEVVAPSEVKDTAKGTSFLAKLLSK